MTTAIGVGTAVSLVNSLTGNSSPQSTLSMINAVQLLLLLPLIGAYLPVDVYEFIVAMSFSLFNFDFLSPEKSTSFDKTIDNFDFTQENAYLSDIGFGSGNSILNTISLTFVAIWIPITHSLVYTIIWLYNKSKEPEELYFFNLFRKIYLLFMLDIYVSFIYEIFLFLMLMFLSNFYQYDNDEGLVKEYVSLGFSIAIALVCLLIFLFTIYFWFRSRDENYFGGIKYFKGFFSGLKDTNKARTL
jgi:hypothetical protein